MFHCHTNTDEKHTFVEQWLYLNVTNGAGGYQIVSSIQFVSFKLAFNQLQQFLMCQYNPGTILPQVHNPMKLSVSLGETKQRHRKVCSTQTERQANTNTCPVKHCNKVWKIYWQTNSKANMSQYGCHSVNYTDWWWLSVLQSRLSCYDKTYWLNQPGSIGRRREAAEEIQSQTASGDCGDHLAET